LSVLVTNVAVVDYEPGDLVERRYGRDESRVPAYAFEATA
jgi:hypothetical protein